MPASLEFIRYMLASGVLSFESTPALFKCIEIGSADAIVVFAATSQVHRWKFVFLYPLIHALFVNLKFTGYLFNSEFYRSLSHRTIPQKHFFL